MTEELGLLRVTYDEVAHIEVGGEDWFKVARYPLPEGWSIRGTMIEAIPVTFQIKADYPGATPYGFLTPTELTFNGTTPQNTGPPPNAVPFEGDWLHFSWRCDDWQGTNDLKTSSNLLTWCRSFASRLREGA